jgi:hypothetical protein
MPSRRHCQHDRGHDPRGSEPRDNHGDPGLSIHRTVTRRTCHPPRVLQRSPAQKTREVAINVVAPKSWTSHVVMSPIPIMTRNKPITANNGPRQRIRSPYRIDRQPPDPLTTAHIRLIFEGVQRERLVRHWRHRVRTESKEQAWRWMESPTRPTKE